MARRQFVAADPQSGAVAPCGQVDEDAEGAPLPVLTLQPLVVNAIKHALNPPTAPDVLAIMARLQGGQLEREAATKAAARLPATRFLRAHRKAILNLDSLLANREAGKALRDAVL